MREQRTIGNRWADLIRAGYEALGRGEIEALTSLLQDAAEWRGVRSGWRRRRAVFRAAPVYSMAILSPRRVGKLDLPANPRIRDP